MRKWDFRFSLTSFTSSAKEKWKAGEETRKYFQDKLKSECWICITFVFCQPWCPWRLNTGVTAACAAIKSLCVSVQLWSWQIMVFSCEPTHRTSIKPNGVSALLMDYCKELIKTQYPIKSKGPNDPTVSSKVTVGSIPWWISALSPFHLTAV